MTRTYLLAAAAFLASTTAVAAFPPWPPPPAPLPASPTTGLEGVWYFRGDPTQPCQIQSVPAQRGYRLVVVNEKGAPAEGRVLWDGHTLVVREWNTRGDHRGERIVWQNGDFWAR